MSDRLLLLYVIARGNEIGSVDGPFKLMKIPFMAELFSTRQKINTFNYSFYRWNFGPLSTEIYEDADALFFLGLSASHGRAASVTAKGKHLLGSVSELFEENKTAMAFVDEAARKCARLNFGSLKSLVYKQTVYLRDGIKSTIADAPMGASVLSSVENPTARFCLSDDWIDTLWGQFNYTKAEMKDLTTIKPMYELAAACQ